MNQTESLSELLGEAAQALIDALTESKARTQARPGDREEIRVVVQGGKVVDVWGPPRRYKVLTKRA